MFEKLQTVGSNNQTALFAAGAGNQLLCIQELRKCRKYSNSWTSTSKCAHKQTAESRQRQRQGQSQRQGLGQRPEWNGNQYWDRDEDRDGTWHTADGSRQQLPSAASLHHQQTHTHTRTPSRTTITTVETHHWKPTTITNMPKTNFPEAILKCAQAQRQRQRQLRC